MTPRWRDAVVAAGVALVSLLLAAVVLEVWRADWSVPFDERDDAIQNQMLVAGAEHGGWFISDDSIGAPAGSDERDYPITGDLLHLGAIKAMTAVTSEPGAVVNTWYLLTFPAVAVVAYVVFRAIGTSRTSGAMAAVLFAFLPAHFVRGEHHLFLAAYVGVPLSAWLVLRALGAPVGGRRAVVVAVAVVVGWTSVYNAAFTVVLLLLAGVLQLVATRRWRALLGPTAVACVIMAAVAVTLAPALVRRIDDGPNIEVARRSAAESEAYALKLTGLVLPVSDHRIDALADLKERYVTSALGNVGEHPDHATLGIVATVGLLLALWAVVGGALRGRPDPPCDRANGVAVLLALAVATVGGGSALIAYVVTPQIRAWGRLSVLIAFFSLLAVALALDRLMRRPPLADRPRLALLLPAAVLVIGLFDQTTSAMAPDHERLAERYSAAERFVSQAEAELPDGGTVLQLPYMPFPEAPPVGRMHAYDHFRPAFAADDLRWTFGAMRGRPEDWTAALTGRPIGEQVVAAAAAGLAAVELDRDGYQDPAAASAAVAAVAGAPLVDTGDRWVLYDLRPLAARMRRELGADGLAAIGTAVLHPVSAAYGEGFHDHESSDTGTWRWAESTATLGLHNPTSDPLEVELAATLALADTSGPATVHVAVPGETPREMVIDASGRSGRIRLTLPPGDTRVTFRTDAPDVINASDPRALNFRLEDLVLHDPRLDPLWEAAGTVRQSPTR